MKELQKNDKIKLTSATGIDHGVCTITKIHNYKSKGKRIYIESQWGYGFMMWLTNLEGMYEIV